LTLNRHRPKTQGLSQRERKSRLKKRLIEEANRSKDLQAQLREKLCVAHLSTQVNPGRKSKPRNLRGATRAVVLTSKEDEVVRLMDNPKTRSDFR
jgi:hypothetical protein